MFSTWTVYKAGSCPVPNNTYSICKPHNVINWMVTGFSIQMHAARVIFLYFEKLRPTELSVKLFQILSRHADQTKFCSNSPTNEM